MVVKGCSNIGHDKAVKGEQYEGGGNPIVAPGATGPQHTDSSNMDEWMRFMCMGE